MPRDAAISESFILREIMTISKEQATIAARLEALAEKHERLSHELSTTTHEIRDEVDRLSATINRLVGKLETPGVTVQAFGSAGTVQGGGDMRDVKVGRINGDFSGGNMNKAPKWIFMVLLALVLVVGAIAGIKAMYHSGDTDIQVEPTPKLK